MRFGARRFRQLRQPAIDRVVEPEHPVVDQEHGGGRRDRLGERGDLGDGVPPHWLAAAGGRRPDRVDEDLTPEEADALRSHSVTLKTQDPELTGISNLKSQSVTSSSWGGRRKLPHAFTEKGVAMLSGVRRSPRAVQARQNVPRPEPTWARRSWFATSDRWGGRA